MIDWENEESRKAVLAYAIVAMNIGLIIIYLAAWNKFNWPYSAGSFLLFCHLAVCIVYAINSKRPAWWVSACIVAVPLCGFLLV